MMRFLTLTALCFYTAMALDPEIPFPGFRYVPWNILSAERQALATTAGWTEASWNQPGNATFESLSFDSVPQPQALLDLGFTVDQYDCYVNHYDYYAWTDLVEYDLDVYFGLLGWTNDSWIGVSAEPASENKTWTELSGTEREAAGFLCYFEGIWDEDTLLNMEVPVVTPDIRFRIWSNLTTAEQVLATTAGWTEATWNDVGTANHEDQAFSSLEPAQQVALTSLGFYEDQYDCHINHYEGYDWVELEEYEIATYYETLGWTQASWEGTADEPASEDKSWADLTATEQAAAEELCFSQEIWDGLSLDGSSPGESSGYLRGVSFVCIMLTTMALGLVVV